MKHDIKICVVGGDSRYRWATEELKKVGFTVSVFGVPGMENTESELTAALMNAKIVLLPMHPLTDGKLTVSQESVDAVMLPELLEPGAVLAAGQLPPKLEAWLSEQGILCYEFLDQENYRLQNAYVTAEGAVGLLLGKLERTVRGSRILITGWGRIGRFLTQLLRDLGAEVTIGVRRETQRDLLRVLGYQTLTIGRYRGKYDAIINTVPAQIFTDKQLLELMEEECVLVELASAPGGFPGEAKFAIVDGRGLPGRTAPRTAGKYLAESVIKYFHGEGRPLE